MRYLGVVMNVHRPNVRVFSDHELCPLHTYIFHQELVLRSAAWHLMTSLCRRLAAFQNAQDLKSNFVSSADVFAESTDAPVATVTHKKLGLT